MAQKFVTVLIQSKPLVKSFLENNFGKPVSIPENHILQKLDCAQLMKNNTRHRPYKEYKEDEELSILKTKYRFDGFLINEANTQNFNNAVDNYIKNLCRSNLDALLISQEKHTEWRSRFFHLADYVKRLEQCPEDVKKQIRKIKREIEAHEMNIKTAIETVVFDFLKLDPDVLSYDTVMKDYYRYRIKKFSHQMSPDIN